MKYVVTLTGTYTESWVIEAENEEEAEEQVRGGEGYLRGDGEWCNKPDASVVEEDE